MMGICWKQRQRIYFSVSTFQVSIQHRASQKPLLRSEEWRICSECAQHIGNKESLLLLLSLVWLNIPPTHLPHKSQKALPPSQYFSPGKILGEPATPVSFPPPCQVEKEEEEGKGREGRRRILKFLALKSNSSRQESVKWLEVSLSVRNLRKKGGGKILSSCRVPRDRRGGKISVKRRKKLFSQISCCHPCVSVGIRENVTSLKYPIFVFSYSSLCGKRGRRDRLRFFGERGLLIFCTSRTSNRGSFTGFSFIKKSKLLFFL